jgi:hypothetical protein
MKQTRAGIGQSGRLKPVAQPLPFLDSESPMPATYPQAPVSHLDPALPPAQGLYAPGREHDA